MQVDNVFFFLCCMFTLGRCHSTHHTNQSRVGFSLLHCHLDHRTRTLTSQHRHGNTVGHCAALPVRRKPDIGDKENDDGRRMGSLCGC